MNRESAPPQWDIIGFGAIAVDDVLEVETYPVPDSKAAVLHRQRCGGGLCATALVAASRLGSRTAFCGVLGNDELSQWSQQELQNEGVDTSQVLAEAAARPHHSQIIVARDTKTRTIFSDGSDVQSLPDSVITRELIGSAKVVFLDHTVAKNGIIITQIARELGVPIVADVERIGPYVEAWIHDVDHLIIGESLARAWTDWKDLPIETIAKRLGRSRRTAVITRGGDGCIFCGLETDAQVLAQRAYEVEVLDTTGCGDVFHGAYAAELARGSDAQTRIEIASAVAAIKAQFRGGRGGLPTRDEALQFLAAFS